MLRKHQLRKSKYEQMLFVFKQSGQRIFGMKNNGLKIMMMMMAMTVIASKSKTEEDDYAKIKKEHRNELYIFQINICSSGRRSL